MKTKNTMKLVALLLVFVLVISGCGKQSTTSSNEATSQPASNGSDSQTNDGSLMGEVTAISDKTITVAIGTQKQMNGKPGDNNNSNQSGQPQGTPPAMKDGATPPPMASGQPQDAQGDQQNSTQGGQNNQQNGQQGGKGGPGGSMLEKTGETKTITVTDSTKITVKSGQTSSDGTISDIQSGTIIKFTLGSDNSAATITVIKMGQRGDNKQQPSGSANPTSTSSSSTK